jgi:hypothetical protein
MLHQGLKALIEAVKKEDPTEVGTAKMNLAGQLKDIVNEV